MRNTIKQFCIPLLSLFLFSSCSFINSPVKSLNAKKYLEGTGYSDANTAIKIFKENRERLESSVVYVIDVEEIENEWSKTIKPYAIALGKFEVKGMFGEDIGQYRFVSIDGVPMAHTYLEAKTLIIALVTEKGEFLLDFYDKDSGYKYPKMSDEISDQRQSKESRLKDLILKQSESAVEYRESPRYYPNEVLKELGLLDSTETLLNIAHNLNDDLPAEIVGKTGLNVLDGKTIRAVIFLGYDKSRFNIRESVQLSDFTAKGLKITIPVNVPPEYLLQEGYLLFTYVKSADEAGYYYGGGKAYRTTNDAILVDIKSGKSIKKYRKILEPPSSITSFETPSTLWFFPIWEDTTVKSIRGDLYQGYSPSHFYKGARISKNLTPGILFNN